MLLTWKFLTLIVYTTTNYLTLPESTKISFFEK